MDRDENNLPACCERLVAAARAPTGRPGGGLGVRGGDPAVLRFLVLLALLVMGAIVVSIALGYVLARQADAYLQAAHRRALAGAVAALQDASPQLAGVEAQVIRVLERASGLTDLRFEREPTGNDRQLQSMLDRNGRIVGWFSWEPEQPATAMMQRFLPLAVLIELGLGGFAALASCQLSRLGRIVAQGKQRMHKLDDQDRLTGLPNHRRFFELLDQALARRLGEEPLVFGVLDLDGFDEVNGALGQAGGDEVLAEIARRLHDSLPPGAVVARLGSDEFGFMILGAGRSAALAAVDTMRRALALPIWSNRAFEVSAGIGIAIAPGHGSSRDELTRRADLALRAAKRSGRGSAAVFTSDMEALFEPAIAQRKTPLPLPSRAVDQGMIRQALVQQGNQIRL